SINKGIWGTSVGGKETLTSDQTLPEEAWPTPVSATEPRSIRIEFKQGEPVALDGRSMTHVELIQTLQSIAQPYGIGRDIHVGDTTLGIKRRVGLQAAVTISSIKPHRTLGKHTVTEWHVRAKALLATIYGNWSHEDPDPDPIMRAIEAFPSSSQEFVNGT